MSVSCKLRKLPYLVSISLFPRSRHSDRIGKFGHYPRRLVAKAGRVERELTWGTHSDRMSVSYSTYRILPLVNRFSLMHEKIED